MKINTPASGNRDSIDDCRFYRNAGEVRRYGPEGMAYWFIDTDYNEESFFVRHACFSGANDPYSALKTTLKAQINEEACGPHWTAILRVV